MTLSNERLAKLRSSLQEQIRLLNVRLSRSAIPEDATEYSELMGEAELKLSLITELQAFRASSGVNVKGLVWSYTEALHKWRGMGPFGEFSSVSVTGRTAEELESAKAAVDAEYCACILSCLSSPLPTVEVTEEMVERACKAADPLLFSEDETIARMAASPQRVDIAQKMVRSRMRAALTAALSQNKGEEK